MGNFPVDLALLVGGEARVQSLPMRWAKVCRACQCVSPIVDGR